MTCLSCRDLGRTLDSRRSKYFEARSAGYYKVSTELAAHKFVGYGARQDRDRREQAPTGISAPVNERCRE